MWGTKRRTVKGHAKSTERLREGGRVSGKSGEREVCVMHAIAVGKGGDPS